MSADRLPVAPVAPLSPSLLARKGSASASGFAATPDAGPPAPPGAGDGAQRRRRILIVEDDLLNRRLMTDLFEAEGYSALEADNGQAALDMARANGPDLIVMDIQLPGLSGLEAIGEIKRDGALREIPVIAVSAMGRPGLEGAVRAAGFDDFLAKPFTLQSMLRTVSRLLH